MVTFIAYFIFGGWKLFTRKRPQPVEMSQSDQAGARADEEMVDVEPFEWQHWLTLAVLVSLVIARDRIAGARRHGGADRRGVAVADRRGEREGGDQEDAMGRDPDGVRRDGADRRAVGRSAAWILFIDLLATISTPGTVMFMIALVTGAVSVYSSTSGVVLPAFLPTVPGLAAQLGADPLSIAAAMYVGGHLVDLSPLSTIGALCIAALPHEVEAKKLFNQLLWWGLSMMIVGAVICWVMFH